MAGKGSYGAVYKARDVKTSELVAVKVISLTEGVFSFIDVIIFVIFILMLIKAISIFEIKNRDNL